ncbi:hypothetical protein L798_08832 [Zootermopsis nevadensis]|uniref:Uncharacterized protein n=1 Tax=Zootermopsis nevadensis TaxID=136037 RepID=A0A067REF3_ZOONE|nr:hypothetical protein L798_08832 [Zootermopsis nevadensis]
MNTQTACLTEHYNNSLAVIRQLSVQAKGRYGSPKVRLILPVAAAKDMT